jgi:hypothetical protein
VLGGWVSTNYAVLACTTFPQCQGSWWPEMAFSEGFQIWRELGHLQDGSLIGFAALTAIHYVHRLAAYGVLLVLALLVWRLRLRAQLLRDQARWLAGLGALQLLTGLSNVILDWPLVAAVLHTGGAAALVVVLTWALVASRSATAEARAAHVFRQGSRPQRGFLHEPGAHPVPRAGARRPIRHGRCRGAAVAPGAVLCADQAARGAAHRVLRLIGMVLAVPGLPSRAQWADGLASLASGWWPARPRPSTASWSRASTPR